METFESFFPALQRQDKAKKYCPYFNTDGHNMTNIDFS